jgi:hypothetical protein
MSASLFDSLMLGTEIELAGGPNGVPSLNPMCPGATFKLDPASWDLGDPQPTTDFTAALAVDGERPFGTRTSDRTHAITVFITAPDYLTLAGAEELLLSTLDAQPAGYFPVTWTPRMTPAQIAAGQQPLPVVFDCFRAQPSKKKWGGPSGYNNEPVSQIVIQYEALPYGRSDVKKQLAFASPIASMNAPAPPPPPVLLDGFTTINSPQCSQSTVCVVGPTSCYWDPAVPPYSAPDGALCPLVYGPVIFPAPLNMTGLTALKQWLGLGSRYYFNHQPRGRTRVVICYTLTDINGNTLSWTFRTGPLPVSQNPQAPAFSLVSVRIPQGNTVFDYAAVVSYELVMYNRGPSQLRPQGEMRWVCCTLDAVQAYPSTYIAAAGSSRGTLYQVNGIAGTHDAPVSVTAQSPPTAGTQTVLTATGPGAYTVPANTLYVGATATGGGGPGATMTAAGQGGGGGGGGLGGEPALPGSGAGVVIPYIVGAGGTPGAAPTAGQASTFGPVPGGQLAVIGMGGLPAAGNTPAGGAGGPAGTNTVKWAGGAGRTATGGLGGGGGSSAGPGAAGNTPQGTASTTYAASGSWPCPAGVSAVTLLLWAAGGGGGAGSGFGFGAGGGGGEFIKVTVPTAGGTSYPFTVGTAGPGGTGGGNGGNGGNTSITIGGVTYVAYGGQGGPGGYYYAQGGGGGQGSPDGGEQPGGSGGGAYPYPGGGGSSAATGQPGNPGSNYGQGGVAPTGGGNGGNGSGYTAAAGGAGVVPGGGGGGSAESGHNGGAGGGGQITFIYSGPGAPTSAGAAAPAGGGAGGAGGATTGAAGTAGTQPGGGGGGGNSGGSAAAGGAGGAGSITVTPYGYAAFPTLLLHRPGLLAPVQLNPLIVLGGVAPGAAEYPVASLVAGVNAQFNGTYTVLAVARSFSSPAVPRTLSLTVNQYEYAGGAKWPFTTTPVTVTPAGQVTNGFCNLGNITLPGKQLAADNTGAYFTAQLNDSNTADTWWDIILIDTNGQCILINEAGAGYLQYYLDEPDPRFDLGNLMGSQNGRPDAISITDAIQTVSGGPLTLQPGDNLLLAYSLSGAPALSIEYFPRWFHGRLE